MPVKKIGESVKYRTRRFDVVEARLRIRGAVVSKPFIRQRECAEILPITGSGSVILIRAYRPELGRYAYELPSGTLRPGEKPVECARRELLEETGFYASKLVHMFSGLPLLGYSDCNLHFFLATGLRRRHQMLEDDESILVKEVRQGKVLKMLKDGIIDDLSVLTAMQHWLALK